MDAAISLGLAASTVLCVSGLRANSNKLLARIKNVSVHALQDHKFAWPLLKSRLGANRFRRSSFPSAAAVKEVHQ
jgi:hypothetical protein